MTQMTHTEEIKDAATKVLEIARMNLVEALTGMEDLRGLVIDQQHRIDMLLLVIEELSKFEIKASNDQR